MKLSCGAVSEDLTASITTALIEALVREAEAQALEQLFRLRPPVNVWLLDEARA